MSQGLEHQRIGWQARVDEWGGVIGWTGANGVSSFLGIIMPLNVIDPQALLGEDIRESDQLQMLQEDDQGIESGDRITKDAATWSVVRRVNSQADFIIIYTLLKVTDKDQ